MNYRNFERQAEKQREWAEELANYRSSREEREPADSMRRLLTGDDLSDCD